MRKQRLKEVSNASKSSSCKRLNRDSVSQCLTPEPEPLLLHYALPGGEEKEEVTGWCQLGGLRGEGGGQLRTGMLVQFPSKRNFQCLGLNLLKFGL